MHITVFFKSLFFFFSHNCVNFERNFILPMKMKVLNIHIHNDAAVDDLHFWIMIERLNELYYELNMLHRTTILYLWKRIILFVWFDLLNAGVRKAIFWNESKFFFLLRWRSNNYEKSNNFFFKSWKNIHPCLTELKN
jgi:hypothetical protein